MALKDLMTQGLGSQYSRRTVLKGSVALGVGATALSSFSFSGLGLTFGAESAGAAPLDSDMTILNYALTLEYLEAAAYKAINDAGVLSGRAANYFKLFGDQEATHRDTLIQTIQKLGGTPVESPMFDFSSVPSAPADIVKFFQTVEAVGVSAYLGAAPSIKNPDILEAALSIHAVEAEHAAALADIVAPGTDLFAPGEFENPRTPDEVLKIVAPFIKAAPAPSPMPGLPNTGGGFGAGVRDLSRFVQ